MRNANRRNFNSLSKFCQGWHKKGGRLLQPSGCNEDATSLGEGLSNGQLSKSLEDSRGCDKRVTVD
jgi:hypothetical protein